MDIISPFDAPFAPRSTSRSAASQAESSEHHQQCSALTSALARPMYSQDLRDVVYELQSILRLSQRDPPDMDEPICSAAEMMRLHADCQKCIQKLLRLPSYGNELCCRLALVLILRHMSQDAAAEVAMPALMNQSEATNIAHSIQRLRRQLQYEILLPSNEISRTTLSRYKPNLGSHPAPSLETHQSTIWTGSSDELLLWILVTGFFAARKAGLEDECDWFGTRATSLMSVLEIRAHDSFRNIVLSFFSTEEMLSHELFCVILSFGDHESPC